MSVTPRQKSWIYAGISFLCCLAAGILVLLVTVRSAGRVVGLAGTGNPARATLQSRPRETLQSRYDGRRIKLGVAIQGAPAEMSVLRAYTRLAGRPPAIVEDFRAFEQPLFYSTEIPNLRRIHATPLITWDPVVGNRGIPLAEVAAGEYDKYLRLEAAAARAWGKPMYIRFAHEMNLKDSQWATGVNGNTSDTYIEAWRHVVSLFRKAGATNVRWVWSPNVDCGGYCPFGAYFPGNAWVNDVGLDGYNYSTSHHVPWLSFDQIFSTSYDEIQRLSDKPVIIGETASSELGGSKAQWIREAFFDDLKRRFTRVVAVIWWDRVDVADWRVNSSPATLEAWRSVVGAPLYGGSRSD
jgi:hypothetical protein